MGDPESSQHRTCTRCTTTTAGTHESPGRHVVRHPSNTMTGATIPWPPCSAPPSNTMSRRHSLHRFRRKRLPIKRHPHDLRGHPVEGGDEPLKLLKIRQYQAHVMLELQRSRQCLLAPHMVEPVFRTTAEQSS